MNTTKADLNKLADDIEQAADGDLRRKATDARSLYSERGYHDLTTEQIEQAQFEGQQAWQGAMQYAQGLRRQAEGMGEGETLPTSAREEAELVKNAAQCEGWLTNAQRMAWDHANNPSNQVWDDGREAAELRNRQHHLQEQADRGLRTGVMVHEDFKPGATVERIKLVPNPNMPPVEDPMGEVPTNTTRPDNEPYPEEGLAPKLEEAERAKAQADQQEQPPASPSAGEQWFRDKAAELRTAAQDRADEAAAEPDHNRQADLYEEARDFEHAAEACEEQADYERDNPVPEPPKDTATQEAEPSYWNTRAEEHRDAAESFDQQAAETTDPDEAQDLRATAVDERNLAEACERNAAMYEEKLPNPLHDDGTTMTDEETAASDAQHRAQAEDTRSAADLRTDVQEKADRGVYDEDLAWKMHAAEQAEQAAEAASKPSEDYRGDAEKTADVENAAAEQAEYEAEYAGETDEVDWAAVEESAGRPIPQEERNELEVARLKDESDALVNAAEHVEGGHEWVKSEIEEAAADGEGVQERWDRQQADMDRWEAAEAQEGTEEWDVATAAGDDAADEAAEDAAVARHENYGGQPTSFSGDGMTFADGSTSAWPTQTGVEVSGIGWGVEEYGPASYPQAGYGGYPGGFPGSVADEAMAKARQSEQDYGDYATA